MFICPLCSKSLTLVDQVYRCPKNHCFDVAKEGYVNLLPLGAKKSKLPGDNKQMIAARRKFLEAGLFSPLAERVCSLVDHHLRPTLSPHIIDIGCGEGFYTSAIEKKLQNRSPHICGLDISKVAIRYGAKRSKNINFCVASAYSLPIKENSIDLALRIYAPSSETELQRVIKPGGNLIIVTPGNKHLYQIREAIYSKVNDHNEGEASIKGFTPIHQESLGFQKKIQDKLLFEALLDMTPFAWKISPELRETLLEPSTWTIDFDFNINIYKRVE